MELARMAGPSEHDVRPIEIRPAPVAARQRRAKQHSSAGSPKFFTRKNPCGACAMK